MLQCSEQLIPTQASVISHDSQQTSSPSQKTQTVNISNNNSVSSQTQSSSYRRRVGVSVVSIGAVDDQCEEYWEFVIQYHSRSIFSSNKSPSNARQLPPALSHLREKQRQIILKDGVHVKRIKT